LDFIESLQPYNAYGSTTIRMGRISSYSNIDKHRYLHMTLAWAERLEKVANKPDVIWESPIFDDTDLMSLASVLTADEQRDGVTTERSFNVFVAFNEPSVGPPTETLVEEELRLSLA